MIETPTRPAPAAPDVAPASRPGGCGRPGALRVLCVTPSGPEGRGGIDRLYYYLRTFAPAEALAGIDLRYVAARGSLPGSLWPLAIPARLVAVMRQIGTFRPQVVHLNFANGGSLWRKYAVLRLARLAGARTLVHLHDRLPLEAIADRRLPGRLFLALCRKADRVVALGEATRRGLQDLGLPAAKLIAVSNGIPDFAPDLALPKPTGQAVSILLAGRVGDHKGVGILLDALALLARRGVGGWTCTIAGDGEVAAYNRRAADLGLSDRVRFTGWMAAEAVHDLMREADIVALPSLSEALPLSLIEGACAGAALVATPVGNVAEVLREGENGIVAARTPEAFADAFARLLSKPAELGRMQVASRRIYRERLTLAGFACNLRAVYLDLVGLDGGTQPASSVPEAPSRAGCPRDTA